MPQIPPLPHWCDLVADETDDRLVLSLAGERLIELQVQRTPQLTVSPVGAADFRGVWAASYWLLSANPQVRRLHWRLADAPAQALASGLLVAAAGEYLCERELFWQLPQPWLVQPGAPYAQQLQITDGKRHPRRAPIRPARTCAPSATCLMPLPPFCWNCCPPVCSLSSPACSLGGWPGTNPASPASSLRSSTPM